MFARERQERIAAEVAQTGRVSVHALADLFDVTQETIRRDLDALAAAGLVRRVHGGAVGSEGVTLLELSLAERRHRQQEEKHRIAQAALRFLPEVNPASIVLDAGTTTELLAESLAERSAETGRSRELLIITNAVPIAHRIAHATHLELELLGGRVRGLTSATVGPQVIGQLQRLRPDIAFIGANGLHPEFGLSTPDSLEAAVKSTMVQTARLVVALMDSSKLGQETLVRFAGLDQIDLLITDGPPPAEVTDTLAAADVDVVIA